MKKILKCLDEILNEFRICFTRKASFEWFVIIVFGIMIRTDNLGITSIIRELSLCSNHYESMIHFFHATSWNVSELSRKWVEIVKTYGPTYKEDGMCVIIGDGVKQSKEARKMPGVKRLHQESENSSKAEYIFGHMFGVVGILIENANKMFCVPVSATIQDGVKQIREWDNQTVESSHVTQMIKNAFDVAKELGSSILLLDRYFLTITALKTLNKLNNSSEINLQIVTKAKKSVIAYEKPSKKASQKGRPRKKGAKIKLKELFNTRKEDFKETKVDIYGKKETVKYLSINLLWGQGLYQELKFVLVKYKNTTSILVTTKLDMTPETIIRLYSYRFKIEVTFRELKQLIGGLSYHFWCKSMPKINKYTKKTDTPILETIKNEKSKKAVIKTLNAIEGFVLCSSIAIGILQIISIQFSEIINKTPFRYLRTVSNKIVSETTVACYLRKIFFYGIAFYKDLSIMQIIKNKQENTFHYKDSKSA